MSPNYITLTSSTFCGTGPCTRLADAERHDSRAAHHKTIKRGTADDAIALAQDRRKACRAALSGEARAVFEFERPPFLGEDEEPFGLA